MEENKYKDPKTINVLLDIDNFFGESSGRLKPVIITAVIAGAPVLLYLYMFIGIIPLKIFLPLEIFFAIRVIMKIIGEEDKRVLQFKKQIFDIYSSSYDLLNIKNIYPDGLVEYIDGNVCYMIIANNGSQLDQKVISNIIKSFMDSLSIDYVPDVYIQNISASETLGDRYSKIKFTGDKEVARRYIEIIDHNRKITEDYSLLMRTIFVIKGRRSQFKDMKNSITNTINGEMGTVYKGLRLADEEEVKSIISRDLDTYIDYEELTMNKYQTGKYHGAKVIGYDIRREEIDMNKKENNEIVRRGFMVKYE